MATTTNYSWTTPDDTDLVKDGAAAIRTLGSSIDTSVKDLSPGTTAGDVDYYTTSTAKARLGIGTAGQVLQVNSGATAPEWATPSSGGMTLLSTTTLSGASTTISGIDQTHKSLMAVIFGVTNATANGFFKMRPNNSSVITTYAGIDSSGAGSATVQSGQLDEIYLSTRQSGLNRTSSNNSFMVLIDNYASTTNYKPLRVVGNMLCGGQGQVLWGGGLNTNSAITSLVLLNTGGNFSTGTVLLYGVS
jgi:hypothetical protein